MDKPLVVALRLVGQLDDLLVGQPFASLEPFVKDLALLFHDLFD